VEPEDRLPLINAGQSHGHRAVEPAGTEQRLIEILGPVGRADHEHPFPLRKAVHLDEQLIERAVVLVVTPVVPPAGAERVDLVDENHAAPLSGFAEQRFESRSAQSDQKTGDFGARDREERHASLAGNGARHEGFAGAGRTVHQDALGDPSAHFVEFAGRFEKLHDLAQLAHGAVVSRYVCECGAGHGFIAQRAGG
jgi:hypothetical protein